MKSIKYNSIKFGIVFGLSSLIIMFLIALIKFGYNELFYNYDNRFIAQYFIPVWAIGLGYAGYGLSKKFYSQKKAILGEDSKKSEPESSVEWLNAKRLFSPVF
ncbi:MAG: hypothetical protein QM751_13645 [Paludibacteraceae bacterium]